MKPPSRKTAIFFVGFAIFLLVFAFALLNYTRRVEGVSMLPTLEDGDLVVIQQTPFSDIHVGDVIVYGSPCSASGLSVIHRVVASQDGGFITRGDNNPWTDQAGSIALSPVTPNCVEGKVVFVVPYVERLASLPDGLNYVLAVAIIFAVIFYEFWGTEEKKGGTTTPTQTQESKFAERTDG